MSPAPSLPGSVYSIIIVEFLERYSYYAMRGILTLYFSTALKLPNQTSISLFLYTSSLAYFTPLLGGYLSDSSWGKYKTIKWFGSVYVFGFLTLAISAFKVSFGGSILGLCLIGIGTGGIKPCVSSFGADQLKTPSSTSLSLSSTEDPHRSEMSEKFLRRYFSLFYFSINVGALISYIVSPMVRHKFGYGAAFFLPGE